MELDVPRHEVDRKGYSKIEWENRSALVDQIAAKNPRLSPFYVEMLYDWLYKKTPKEREQLVNEN